MTGQYRRRATAALVFVALLARMASAATNPFATVTSDDGTQYFFYRTGSPITALAASATCAAAGMKLASFTSADQVLSTLWSPSVVEAASEETALIWTGLKITWPTTTAAASSQRRMLRGANPHHHHHAQQQHHTAFDNDNANEDYGLTLLERLAREMDASADFVVPTHTHDGRRRLPQLLRLWLFQQHSHTHRHRALLARDGGSPYLDDAKLSWADGSETDFILSNPANMGFLACNPKKLSACCGAVFDIGPDPYPGSDFPTIFFYPCGAEKISGAVLPAGYVCQSEPAVAELPKTTPPAVKGDSAAKSPSSSSSPGPAAAAPKCKPGSAPPGKPNSHACIKCKAGMFSDDGTKCKKCPAGTTSAKGSAACK